MGTPPRRRPRGTGTVRLLPSGHFQARSPDQRTVRTFPHEHDAHLWLDREQHARILSPEVRALRGALRLRDLRDEHLADLEQRGCSAEHIRGRRSHLDIVCREWGETLVDRIDGPFLERVVSEMHKAGLSPSTISNRLEAITVSVRLAMRKGWTNPRTLPVSRPSRVHASRPPRLTREQCAALLDRAREAGPWWHGVFALALGTGLRRGELYRFRREDIVGTPPAVVVPVRDAFDKPKSGRERWVPVDAAVVALVAAVGGDRPFAVPGGLSEFDRRACPVWASAGLPGRMRWHLLRYTWASEMADAGAHYTDLMEWGGWSSPAMVRRYYRGPVSPRRGPTESASRHLLGTPPAGESTD